MAISAIAMTIVAATKYTRSSSAISYEKVLLPLVQSDREYCLVLRPFGRDGQIIAPKAMHKNRVGGSGFTRNMTLEQIVAASARSALGLETYGIVDQKTLVVPPGPTFMRVPDEERQTVVQRLIRRAHSIVLILPPDRDMGNGFAWEVEQIVRSGVQSRVIVVLPPYDQDVYPHQAALRWACVLLILLHGSGRQAELDHFTAHEYELRLGATTQVVKYRERHGTNWWVPVPEANPRQSPVLRRRIKTVVADVTYLSGLVEAFRETEHELAELSFAARYPLR